MGNTRLSFVCSSNCVVRIEKRTSRFTYFTFSSQRIQIDSKMNSARNMAVVVAAVVVLLSAAVTAYCPPEAEFSVDGSNSCKCTVINGKGYPDCTRNVCSFICHRDFYWSPCILCTCKNTAHFRTGIYKCSENPEKVKCSKNWLSD